MRFTKLEKENKEKSFEIWIKNKYRSRRVVSELITPFNFVSGC